MAKTNDDWMSAVAGRPIHVDPPADLRDVERIRSLLPPDTPLPRPGELGMLAFERYDLGDAGSTPAVEVYVPEDVAAGSPLLVWMHGGGWCTGSAASARETPIFFARAGLVVANVDYALAPERPFPAALRDVLAVLAWLGESGADLGLDAGRVVVGGASAGANLAASAAVASADDGALDRLGHVGARPVRAVGLALLYGVFDFPLMNAEPGSNAGFVEVLFNRGYLGPSFLTAGLDPLVSPARTPRPEVFPPVYLACGSEDSLLGQSLGMAKVLAGADVPVDLSVVSGLDHSFDLLVDRDDRAAAEMRRMAEWIVAI